MMSREQDTKLSLAMSALEQPLIEIENKNLKYLKSCYSNILYKPGTTLNELDAILLVVQNTSCDGSQCCPDTNLSFEIL